jgi:hypothetical protein
VYALGRYLGPVGQKLETDCGPKFLRIGDPPPAGATGVTSVTSIKWKSAGKSALVACKSVTKVTLDNTSPAPQQAAPSNDPY